MRLQILGARGQGFEAEQRFEFCAKSLGAFAGVSFASRAGRSRADIVIHTDLPVRGGTDQWTRSKPTGNDQIHLAFVDHHGSELPGEWTSAINHNVDAVLVATEWLARVCSNSGVTKPIFRVSPGLDLEPYVFRRGQRVARRSDQPLRFGAIGVGHPRERLDDLVRAFDGAFGPTPSEAQLLIHAVDASPEMAARLSRIIRNLGSNNVTLSLDSIGPAELADLTSTLDGYVSISAGEGLATSARRALAAGIPLLLADDGGHADLVAAGLAEAVPARIPRPATGPETGGRAFGLRYDVALRETVNRWRAFAAKIRSGEFRSGEARGRAFSEATDVQRARFELYGLANLGAITGGESNRLESFAPVTKDAEFIAKVRRVRAQTPRKRMVHVAHDGGLFSIFNVFLSHLVWNQGKNGVTHVLPDWRVSTIKNFFGKSEFTSFCYAQPEDGNLWLKLFEPLYDDVDERDYQSDDGLYRDSARPFHSWNKEKEPLLTNVEAYQLYRRRDFQDWRVWYNSYLRRFVRPRPRILREVAAVRERMGDDYIIGMHVRHPSHAMEQPGQKITGFDRYIELARQIVRQKRLGERWKIFLATDQDRVVDYFSREFGDRLITVTDVARTTEQEDASFDRLDGETKLKEGFQMLHLKASNPASWSPRLGEEVMIDALLLAECQSFIHITSNIATAVAILNPRLEMIYCE